MEINQMKMNYYHVVRYSDICKNIIENNENVVLF